MAEKVVTVASAAGVPVNLTLVEGRVKFSYRDDPPTEDLVEALREYDSGMLARDLPYLAKGIAQLMEGQAVPA